MTFELIGLAELSGGRDPGVFVLFTASCLPLFRRGFLGTENVVFPKVTQCEEGHASLLWSMPHLLYPVVYTFSAISLSLCCTVQLIEWLI